MVCGAILICNGVETLVAKAFSGLDQKLYPWGMGFRFSACGFGDVKASECFRLLLE